MSRTGEWESGNCVFPAVGIVMSRIWNLIYWWNGRSEIDVFLAMKQTNLAVIDGNYAFVVVVIVVVIIVIVVVVDVRTHWISAKYNHHRILESFSFHCVSESEFIFIHGKWKKTEYLRLYRRKMLEFLPLRWHVGNICSHNTIKKCQRVVHIHNCIHIQIKVRQFNAAKPN